MHVHHTNLDITATPGEALLYLTDGTVQVVPAFLMKGMFPIPKKPDYWGLLNYLFTADPELNRAVKLVAIRMFAERKRKRPASINHRVETWYGQIFPAFVEVTGMSLKFFFYRFAHALRRAYVIDGITMKFAWRHATKTLDLNVVNSIARNLTTLRQLQADNLMHLAPFAIWCGLDPHKARALLGRGLWRKLCRNSTTRNILIGSILGSVLDGRPFETVEDHDKMLREHAAYLVQLPSTVLKGFRNVGMQGRYWGDEIHKILTLERLEALKGRATWKQTMYRLNYGARIQLEPNVHTMVRYTEVLDAYRGVSNAAKPMTLYQIAVRHHNMLIEQRRRDELRRAELLGVVLDPIEVHSGDISAFRITTFEDIIKEGASMHHCVSSYWDLVAVGTSVIFSIEKAGKHVATAELVPAVHPVEESAKWRLNQVRGPCNGWVDDDVQSFAAKLVKTLSKCNPNPPTRNGGADCLL